MSAIADQSRGVEGLVYEYIAAPDALGADRVSEIPTHAHVDFAGKPAVGSGGAGDVHQRLPGQDSHTPLLSKVRVASTAATTAPRWTSPQPTSAGPPRPSTARRGLGDSPVVDDAAV